MLRSVGRLCMSLLNTTSPGGLPAVGQPGSRPHGSYLSSFLAVSQPHSLHMVASLRLSNSACCSISRTGYTSTRIDRMNYAGAVGFEEDVELLGVLVEPQRRRIYDELAQA